MGVTPKRITAMMFSIISYFIILAIMVWVIRPPDRDQNNKKLSTQQLDRGQSGH
jgi:preprotein translocase subunit YajC